MVVVQGDVQESTRHDLGGFSLFVPFNEGGEAQGVSGMYVG